MAALHLAGTESLVVAAACQPVNHPAEEMVSLRGEGKACQLGIHQVAGKASLLADLQVEEMASRLADLQVAEMALACRSEELVACRGMVVEGRVDRRLGFGRAWDLLQIGLRLRMRR